MAIKSRWLCRKYLVSQECRETIHTTNTPGQVFLCVCFFLAQTFKLIDILLACVTSLPLSLSRIRFCSVVGWAGATDQRWLCHLDASHQVSVTSLAIAYMFIRISYMILYIYWRCFSVLFEFVWVAFARFCDLNPITNGAYAIYRYPINYCNLLRETRGGGSLMTAVHNWTRACGCCVVRRA